jgi:hypothetical protein
MRKFSLTITVLFFQLISLAQQPQQVEMADVMRRDGKIYTVVAVILTILFGLFIYLIFIDRKLSKLEKDFSASTSNH